jgi:hypothetical protein
MAPHPLLDQRSRTLEPTQLDLRSWRPPSATPGAHDREWSGPGFESSRNSEHSHRFCPPSPLLISSIPSAVRAAFSLDHRLTSDTVGTSDLIGRRRGRDPRAPTLPYDTEDRPPQPGPPAKPAGKFMPSIGETGGSRCARVWAKARAGERRSRPALTAWRTCASVTSACRKAASAGCSNLANFGCAWRWYERPASV